MAVSSSSGARRKNFWSPDSSPGAIRPKLRRPKPRRPKFNGERRAGSARDGARDIGPFARRALDDAAGVGEKGRARLGVKEEIKPLAGHRPEQGVTRHRIAASDRHRIVTAKARMIDLRVVGKGRPIALVAKPPNRAVDA